MSYKTLRIFNFTQANFIYKNGGKIINLGFAPESGDPYVRFEVNDEFKNAMDLWMARCEERRKEKQMLGEIKHEQKSSEVANE